MFGTYVEETEEAVYGVLRKNYSYCPNKIFFQYWSVLWKHTAMLKGFGAKIKYLFCPLDELNKRYPEFAPKNEIPYNKDELNKRGILFLIITVTGALYLMSMIISKSSPFHFHEKVIGSICLWFVGMFWGRILDGNVKMFLKKTSTKTVKVKV